MTPLNTNGAAVPLSTNAAAGSTRARGYLGHQLPDWYRLTLAVDHYEEGRPITAPTMAQVAFAYRVPLAAVIRERNKRNSKVERNGHNGHSETKPTLADLLVSASPTELITAAKTVGIEKIWDAMIAPLVGNGKAAG